MVDLYGERKVGSVQLKLVQPAMQQQHDAFSSADPTRRIFQHWLDMLGKSPRRCKLGPVRRQAINAALVLYDEDQVCMAIEGCAADAWCAGDNPARREFTDLEWILRSESSIERFSEAGDRLRAQAAKQELAAQQRAAAPSPEVVQDEAAQRVAAAAAKERLRKMAARMSGRADTDA